MRVLWTVPARDDLAGQRTYLERRNPRAAKRIVPAIIEAVAALPRAPGIGRPGRLVGTRELVVPGTPYIVPYRVRGERLEILRVLQGARRRPEAFDPEQ